MQAQDGIFHVDRWISEYLPTCYADTSTYDFNNKIPSGYTFVCESEQFVCR